MDSLLPAPKTLVFAVMVGAAAWCPGLSAMPASPAVAAAGEAAVAMPKPGTLAPDFTVRGPNGRNVSLHDFRGKVVAVDFWATWCGPCQSAMPNDDRVYRKYEKDGFVLLGVCTHDPKRNYDGWVRRNAGRYAFPTAWDTAGTDYRTSFVNREYGVTGFPTTFVIGRDGRIVGTVIGGGPGIDHRLERMIARAGIPVDTTGFPPAPATSPGAPKSIPMATKTPAMPAARFGDIRAGRPVEDFKVLGVHGRPIRLSDFKGKTVVLHFWLAGNGPKPDLERVYRLYHQQGVVVLGICAASTRAAFDTWVADHPDAASYLLAWDPAGRAWAESISNTAFGIGMYPATGVINREGEVVGGFIGYGPGSPVRLRRYLAEAGVKLVRGDAKSIVAIPAARIMPHPPAPTTGKPVATLRSGAMAPDFTAYDVAGRPVKVSDYRGKIVVLDFWATWCGPCMASMPHTEKVASETKDQGVVVLASCTSDTRANFTSWVKANQTKYPDVRFTDDPDGRDKPSAQFARRASHALYGVQGIPTQFVIDRTGRIARVLVGYDHGDARLEAALAGLGVKLDAATVAEGRKQLQAEQAAAKPTAKPPARKFDLDHFGKFRTGEVIPDFTAVGPDGQTVKLSDFRGKTVILDFWATWCGPCQMAMPHYEAMYRKYKDRGLVVLGICAYDTRQNYEQWLKKNRGKYTFPTAFDPAGKARTPAQFATTIGQKVFGTVFLLPTTGVINPQGVLVGGYAGFGRPDPGRGYPGSVDFLENLLLRAGFKLDPADLPRVVVPVMKASSSPATAETKVRLLRPGAVAPDFTNVDVAGNDVRLSDFKGKVVVLDFWATWCGPCMASLPHTEKVAAETRDQGVVFLASCTADSRANFRAWVPRHQAAYADLRFAFDPAERSPDRISRQLYGVTGIPTQYVIGRDGRVAAVLVGYDGPKDVRLERALAAAGVKIDLSKLPPPVVPGPTKTVPALKLKPAPGV